MRILFISRCPPYPLHLGDRLILWHLAKQLKVMGFTLDLLALAQFDSDWQEIEHYRYLFEHIDLFTEQKRSPLMAAQRLLNPYPKTAAQAWQKDLWQVIEQQLSQVDYDVVHLFGGIQVYEFAHLLRHKKTIITPYESYSLYLKRLIAQEGSIGNRFTRFMAQAYERLMFSPFSKTVVLSEEDKAELLRINPKLDTEVIPNGIDLDYFAPIDIPRDKNTLLFVGNYEYAPNHDAALLLAKDIFPKVRQNFPLLRLQLVGNAPSAEMLALQSESIEVTGRVPDIRPYYAKASIFVCPLRIGAGIKNKLLEAMAMGIPIVASPLSMEGIRGERGEDVLLGEVEVFPDLIEQLLKDDELRLRLSKQTRPIIEAHYSWQSVAEAYLKLYHN